MGIECADSHARAVIDSGGGEDCSTTWRISPRNREGRRAARRARPNAPGLPGLARDRQSLNVELSVRAARVLALLAFNVGVELGQLAIVALIWPALRALEARRPVRHRGVAEWASAGICGLGLYWFLSRALA